MAEMKVYRIYFSNGKDVRIEAEGYEITRQGHLRLHNYDEQRTFTHSVFVVNSNHWTIIDIAPSDDEKNPTD